MCHGSGVTISMMLGAFFDGEGESSTGASRSRQRLDFGIAEPGCESVAARTVLGRASSVRLDGLGGVDLEGILGERSSRRERGMSSWLVLSLYIANWRRKRRAAAFCWSD